MRVKGVRGIIAVFLFSSLFVRLAAQTPTERRDFDDQLARTLSDNIGFYLLIPEASLFMFGGKKGQHIAFVGAEALVYTGGATSLLKIVTHEKRPNSNSHLSFPSGHTSSAFALATVIAENYPALAIPSYLSATVMGWSRIELGAHHIRDVVGGALLGYFIAEQVQDMRTKQKIHFWLSFQQGFQIYSTLRF